MVLKITFNTHIHVDSKKFVSDIIIMEVFDLNQYRLSAIDCWSLL